MSDLLYSLLLRLYPRAFRERYAEEMLRVFRDRLRDERAARVWIDVLVDAAVSIPRQHLVREPHPIYPASAAPVRAAHAPIVLALIVTALVSSMLVGALGVVSGSAASGLEREAGAWMTRFPAGWLLAGLLLVGWFITVRRAYRMTQTIKACRAAVGGDSVTVEWPGLAPLSVARSEVIGVHVFERIGLRIQTADPARDLWVPASTESYPRVKELLGEWGPVTVTPFHLTLGAEPSFPQLAVLYALALFVSTAFAAFVSGMVLVRIPAALAKREYPVHMKVLALGPMAILLVRCWLSVR